MLTMKSIRRLKHAIWFRRGRPERAPGRLLWGASARPTRPNPPQVKHCPLQPAGLPNVHTSAFQAHKQTFSSFKSQAVYSLHCKLPPVVKTTHLAPCLISVKQL